MKIKPTFQFTLKKGDVIGEEEFLECLLNRTSTVTCLSSDAQVLVLDYNDFKELMIRNK